MADEIITENPEGATAAPPPPPPETENTGVPPVKKRGRPPGSGKKTPESIEAGGAPVGGATKPGKRPKQSFDRETIGLMGKQLVGLHLVAAMSTGLPEMQLNDAEGLALAQGIIGVCEQYDLSLDGKTGAALQLAMTAGMIYGPRLLAVRKRAAAEQAARTVSTTDNNGNQSASAN